MFEAFSMMKLFAIRNTFINRQPAIFRVAANQLHVCIARLQAQPIVLRNTKHQIHTPARLDDDITSNPLNYKSHISTILLFLGESM